MTDEPSVPTSDPSASTSVPAGTTEPDVGTVPTPPPHEPESATAVTEEPDSDDESLLSFLKELPVLLLIAFVLAFLLRTFVVQVFYIPSGSMEETLQLNDRMIVEKVTYRFTQPDRGEIVVFEGETTGFAQVDRGLPGEVVHRVGQFLGIVPADARDFVKRVIGLPGDEVRIDEQGVVYVNDTPLDEPYKLVQERAYGPVTVPEGKLFLLGDNRGNSSDSRSPTLGFVDIDQVIGRAVLIIWPPDRFGLLDEPDYGPIPAPDGQALGVRPLPGPHGDRVEVPAA